MNKFTYFIDSLNLYSNLLIAGLTIAVVYFTFRSLRSSQVSFRLNALPILFPKVSVTAKGSVLTLENHSSYPAYDIDLWIIGNYFQDKTPYKSLLSKKYKDEVKISFSHSLYPYKSTHYGVVDRIAHYAFPPQSRCVMDLEFNIPPDCCNLVLQFRDTAGNNYLYQSWFFTSIFQETQKDLRLGFVKSSFKPRKRIEFIEYYHAGTGKYLRVIRNIFEGTDHIFFPVRLLRLVPLTFELFTAKIRAYSYLEKDIKDILYRSFPSGYQTDRNSRMDIEGRGTFTSI